MEISVRLLPGVMREDELLVQLVVGPGDGSNFIGKPDTVTLTPHPEETGDALLYEGRYTPTHNGLHMYGVRVMPVTEGLDSPLETHLVLWG